jgi:uncharacterized protein YndB with AHSA1/START domain
LTTKERVKITARGDRELAIERGIAAPRRWVFDALTRPETVKRWMGPRTWPVVVCKIDLRVGGAYRFVSRNAEGAEMGWGGVYREIDAPRGFTATERFDEAWYPGEAVVTYTLEEADGRTRVRCTVAYESREARDGALASPMEGGLNESFERLEILLARQI